MGITSFTEFINEVQQIEIDCCKEFDVDGWNLFINGKYFRISTLYCSGGQIKNIIFLDKNNFTVEDLVYFISWENSKQKLTTLTYLDNKILILNGVIPIINEFDGYIELHHDYIRQF
jgi:hypothetical protein